MAHIHFEQELDSSRLVFDGTIDEFMDFREICLNALAETEQVGNDDEEDDCCEGACPGCPFAFDGEDEVDGEAFEILERIAELQSRIDACNDETPLSDIYLIADELSDLVAGYGSEAQLAEIDSILAYFNWENL